VRVWVVGDLRSTVTGGVSAAEAADVARSRRNVRRMGLRLGMVVQ
jgi:hypothetical protein